MSRIRNYLTETRIGHWLSDQWESHPVWLVGLMLAACASLSALADLLYRLFAPNVAGNLLEDFSANIATEAASIAITVLIIDALNERRQEKQTKERLTRDLLSRVPNWAVRAVDELRHHGWLDEVLAEVKYKLSKSKLNGAALEEVDLSEADLDEADLRGANLFKANLSEAKLLRANLHKANLAGINLVKANLVDANLSSVRASKAELGLADLQGAILQNAMFDGAYFGCANLANADLSGANLIKADLSGAVMIGTNLANANLKQATLRGAILNPGRAYLKFGVYLVATIQNPISAMLSKSQLYEANLEDANLYGADLKGADLKGANLEGANLNGADMEGANLEGVNLNRTKITIDQLKSAETFEGAKLPEELQKQLEREESEQPADDSEPPEADDQLEVETGEEAPAAADDSP